MYYVTEVHHRSEEFYWQQVEYSQPFHVNENDLSDVDVVLSYFVKSQGKAQATRLPEEEYPSKSSSL